MIFLDELAKSYCNPITPFRYKDLSISGMLAPCTPFTLLLSLNIVKKDAGSCEANWIIIELIAHDDQPPTFQPSYSLHMNSFHYVLLFFRKLQLALELIQAAHRIDSDLTL